MEVSRIISEIDAQISKLEQAKALLLGIATPTTGRGRPRKATATSLPSTTKTPRKKRNLSADARKRIAEAQKRRWAERRKES